MSLRSIVYLLLSVVVAVAGVALVFASERSPLKPGAQPDVYDPVLLSIATSLVAAGCVSVLFTIVREIDQRDSARSNDRLTNLIELERDLRRGLSELRRTLLVTNDPDARRIFDTHPVQQVREEIAGTDGSLAIDAVGISLKALYHNHIKDLASRGDCAVRLLLQDPCHPTFAIMCSQEARDREAMTRDVIQVTKLAQQRSATKGNPAVCRIEVKWLQAVAPLSLTRVNDWRVVRPRFFDEGAGHHGFFEQYSADDSRASDILDRYFDAAWFDAVTPDASRIKDAEKLCAKLRKKSHHVEAHGQE